MSIDKNVQSMPMGTLYSMNKQLMKDKNPMSPLEIIPIRSKVEDWFNMAIDNYAMLLCHDRHDFTIFHLYESQNMNPPNIAMKELFECLHNRGKILSIDKTEDNAWEIWLKIEDEPYCYYLFCYDDAVIEC